MRTRTIQQQEERPCRHECTFACVYLCVHLMLIALLFLTHSGSRRVVSGRRRHVVTSFCMQFLHGRCLSRSHLALLETPVANEGRSAAPTFQSSRMSKWTLAKRSPPFPSPLHEHVQIWNNSSRKHERMGELSATPAMAKNSTKVGLHVDTAQLQTQGRSTSASSTTRSATWIDSEGDSPCQDRTSPHQGAHRCELTSKLQQQRRPVHDGERVWHRKDRRQTQPPDHPTAPAAASSSTPFSFPAGKEREANDNRGTSPSVITSTWTLRDLVPDASVDTWRPGSTFMDGALDLSDVWERRQVMTAQMAAHQCLGKMLTDMGHASPERLIDRIYLGLHLDILTAKQAQHLKSLNAAANNAKHHITR